MKYRISQFQTVAVFLVTAGFFVSGCAFSGMRTEPVAQTSDAKIQAAENKYGKAVRAVPLVEISSSVQCKDQVTSIGKSLSWQESVKLASGCAAKKKWAQVEKWGEWLAKQEPRAPWGPYFLSLAAEGQSHLPRALWMAELALKKAPSNGLLTFHKARLLFSGGARSEALKLFERAASLDPRLTDAHIILAQQGFDEADWTRAEHYYKMALSADKKNLSALLGLAQLHMQTKSFSEALLVLATAALEYPRNIDVQMMFGKALEMDESHLGEAIQAYRKSRVLAHEARAERSVIDGIDAKIKEIEARLPAALDKFSLRETEDK